MSLTCPACGATKIVTKTNRTTLPKVFNEPVEYEERIDCCEICGECGDFAGENEPHILAAMEVAKKRVINHVIDDLSKNGIKMAYFERALDLPPRTVSRWKNGECSASSVALLRTIGAYPWILEVADSDFDPYIAKMKLMESATQVFGEALMMSARSVSFSYQYDSQGIDFDGRIVLDPAYQKEELLQPMIYQLASNGD
jgi:hypothetical protein